MLVVYFECFQNVTIAERIYAESYPVKRHYTRKLFRRHAILFKAIGKCTTHFSSFQTPLRIDDNIINVLAIVETNPHLSGSTIAICLDRCVDKNPNFFPLFYGLMEPLFLDAAVLIYAICKHKQILAAQSELQKQVDCKRVARSFAQNYRTVYFYWQMLLKLFRN